MVWAGSAETLNPPISAKRSSPMTLKIRPIRIEGNIAYVPLTKGYEAVIDASDVPIVEKNNWHAMVSPRSVYAAKNSCRGGKRVMVIMHRLLIQAPDKLEVDHIDGDGLNNSRCNLRLATKAQNAHNSRTPINNTSGYKGVWWNKRDNVFLCRIGVNGKYKHLGSFRCATSAHLAYRKASAELHGAFGRAE